MDKRFIEESFPVKEVGKEAAREKSIRHGHISTFHIWWTRKPLASSRTINYAALIPSPKDEIEWVNTKNFIIDLSKWENSNNQNLIEKARMDILEANDGVPPKVLDPFAGGGTIPLEALRLGCETHSIDYNPVATLIQKCTLDFPQKFIESGNDWSEFSNNKLVDDLHKWGKWVIDKVKIDVKMFYPQRDSLIPVAYYWMNTVPCQNPSCGAEIPLAPNYWLARTKKKKIALKPIINNKKIFFEIVGQDTNLNDDFDPFKGSINQAIVECPVCRSSIDAKITRKLFREGKSGERLVAIVYTPKKGKGKIYKIPDEKDLVIFNEIENTLAVKREKLITDLNIDPVPDEIIVTPNNKEYEEGSLFYNFFPIVLYGKTRWGDLFNIRQKLVLITFVEKIRDVYKEMILCGYDEEYAKAITSYLAIALDRLASYNTKHAPWHVTGEKATQVFGRQAISMVWDFAETNPFSTSFSWQTQIDWISLTIKSFSAVSNKVATIKNASATSLPYPNDFFDAIFTDPPYYDNVPYSYLSDFFYVWLKRIIGDLYPELFVSPLTPKKDEVIADLPLLRGMKKTEAAKVIKNIKNSEKFEELLKESFKEIYRVLKPNGIITIVYAHKTTKGWETVINAILGSGLTVTASWPLLTEMAARLRAQKSAVLASSIYIVARKIDKKEFGWFKNVKEEIKNYIPQKLDKLWEEGISGADFFIAAIGSSIEIFGKYEKVLDNEGNEIKADDLLNFVNDVVSDYTIRQILHNGIADELSSLTKFYLMWRWNYKEVRVPFDDARKIAQSAGIDLSNEWNKGFILKRGEFITVEGPDNRDKKSLEDSKELIDVIHLVCLLWKDGKKDDIKYVVKNSGYGEGEALYKVAQAIAETLPNTSSEKKMIEGFLAGRDKIIQDIREDESQTKLV